MQEVSPEVVREVVCTLGALPVQSTANFAHLDLVLGVGAATLRLSVHQVVLTAMSLIEPHKGVGLAGFVKRWLHDFGDFSGRNLRILSDAP